MQDKVDELIVRATTDCGKDFQCLNGAGGELCAVKHCVRGKVHFIECMNDDYCAYQMSFGNSFVCNCPTRKELYNRYGV